MLTFVGIAPTITTMSFRDVAEARRKLANKVEAARRTAEELPALERKLAAYDAVLSDLRESSNGHHQPPTRTDALFGDYTTMTRGEAVRAVLSRLPGSSPEKIVHVLRGAGRTVDDTHKVSNELNRMQKRELVTRRGRGRWFLVDQP